MSMRFPISSLSCALLLLTLTGLATLKGATATYETGARLLLAELPAGTTIPQTNCNLLAHAVNRATLAHPDAAQPILVAALAGIGGKAPSRKDRRKNPRDNIDEERSCPCIRHIVHESVVAAPEQASFLLEIAMAYYPECSDDLERVLDGIDNPATHNYDASGFGVGFGPGFPGSPGFTGSAPAGATALPTPSPVTSVVNG